MLCAWNAKDRMYGSKKILAVMSVNYWFLYRDFMTTAEDCYSEFSFAYCGIKEWIAWDPVPNIFSLIHSYSLTIIMISKRT